MLGIMILELRNNDIGRFALYTATGSEYLLDLDKRTLTRTIHKVAPLVDFLDAGFSVLRRDGETLPMLLLERLKVGYPASFFLQIRDDHVPTSRTTSPVVRIVPLDEVE
jgi:hypothetical protein